MPSASANIAGDSGGDFDGGGVGALPGRNADGVIPDRGCAFSPRCADCWLRECYFALPVVERQELRETLKALQRFQRQADRTLPTD